MSKNDKELFRDYMMSTEAGRGGDSNYTLYFTGFECFGIDEMLRDVMNSIVSADPEPVEELELLEQELRGVLSNVIRVKNGFIAYKAKHGQVA